VPRIILPQLWYGRQFTIQIYKFTVEIAHSPSCGTGYSLPSETANLRANIHAIVIYKSSNSTSGSRNCINKNYNRWCSARSGSVTDPIWSIWENLPPSRPQKTTPRGPQPAFGSQRPLSWELLSRFSHKAASERLLSIDADDPCTCAREPFQYMPHM